MKSPLWLAAAAVLALPRPLAAEPLVPHGQSAEDEARIDALVHAVIDGLAAGKPREAINGFFATNPLIETKRTEIENFILQAEGTAKLYGPVHDCQLVEKQSRGSWAQSRLYMCRHDSFLTRWIFRLIQTKNGWQAGNLSFDDKYGLEMEP